MRPPTWNEIEYLNSIDGNASRDTALIQEMSRRLDALRRFDQNFCDVDWRPQVWRADPPRNAG